MSAYWLYSWWPVPIFSLKVSLLLLVSLHDLNLKLWSMPLSLLLCRPSCSNETFWMLTTVVQTLPILLLACYLGLCMPIYSNTNHWLGSSSLNGNPWMSPSPSASNMTLNTTCILLSKYFLSLSLPMNCYNFLNYKFHPTSARDLGLTRPLNRSSSFGLPTCNQPFTSLSEWCF